MSLIQKAIVVLITILHCYSFADTENQIYLLNTMVMKQYENSFTNFLPHRTSSDLISHIKAYDIAETNGFKNLDMFKEISHDVGICGGFTQVSKEDLPRIQSNILAQRKLKNQEQNFRYKMTLSPRIQNAMAEITTESFKRDIDFITSFKTRSARNSNNSEIEKIKKHIVENLPPTNLKFTVELITHKRTPQKSIHIQVKGQSDTRLVMGGHIDSINQFFGSSAPGADDNASGSSALIQVLSVILKQNTIPNHTMDFYWYAGEESGLIGSGEIAKDYAKNRVAVAAVLQLDMLGVPDNSGEIYLESDYSSTKLNTFITEVAAVYLPSVSIAFTSCGYPCSDHSSWYQENYPVVFPTSSDASNYNRRIHTDRDTVDTIDFTYAIQVTRLSLAYLLAADQGL